MSHSTDALLQVAQIVPATEAEGPGRRFAIWLQGCPLRCPGCCNPEMLPFAGGRATAVEEVCRLINEAHRNHDVEGITLLGGEPFAQASGAASLAQRTQALDLSVMVFSGFELEELRARGDRDIDSLLAATDILVDGPYFREQPDTARRWIGSANQRVHFLSGRYQADDPCWLESDTLELRLVNGELTVNGFPSQHARELWKHLGARSHGRGT